MSELKIGQKVQIAEVDGVTYREPIQVPPGTIGVIEEIRPYTDDYEVCVDGSWYFRDELTPLLAYQELKEQRDTLLAALERLLDSLETHSNLVDMDDDAWEQARAATVKACD